MNQGKQQKTPAFVGFYTSPEQAERIQRAAKRDDRTVSSWMRKRLDHLFEIDEQIRDRRPTLSQ